MADERAFILAEIIRLSREHGRSPGIVLFSKSTGISIHRVLGVYWARWSDALAEAGLASNELTKRIDSGTLLEGLALLARRIGRFPAQADIKIAKRQGETVSNPDVYADRFGGAVAVRTALREYCEENTEFADVLTLIPCDDQDTSPLKPSREGHVYLLRNGNHYKIGRTETLERRIREIGIALPEATTLIHSIVTDDPVGIEGYWHRRFADRRANGEWFKLAREDIAAFRRRKFQ